MKILIHFIKLDCYTSQTHLFRQRQGSRLSLTRQPQAVSMLRCRSRAALQLRKQFARTLLTFTLGARMEVNGATLLIVSSDDFFYRPTWNSASIVVRFKFYFFFGRVTWVEEGIWAVARLTWATPLCTSLNSIESGVWDGAAGLPFKFFTKLFISYTFIHCFVNLHRIPRVGHELLFILWHSDVERASFKCVWMLWHHDNGHVTGKRTTAGTKTRQISRCFIMPFSGPLFIP